MTASPPPEVAAVLAEVARVAETVIGLGVDVVAGCSLCSRALPCPTHTGEAVAAALVAAGLVVTDGQAVALESLARLSEASTDGRLRDAIALVRSALWDRVDGAALTAAGLVGGGTREVSDG